MPLVLAYLADRNDPRVQEALTRRCGICHVPANRDCRHPWETSEPLGRVVHQERVEQALDKPQRTKR
jgi:hypothetical protein